MKAINHMVHVVNNPSKVTASIGDQQELLRFLHHFPMRNLSFKTGGEKLLRPELVALS